MPILFALVFLVGGGLLYALLALGHVPVKLFLIIAALTIVTAWSIVKSLFVRSRDVDPGERLDLERSRRSNGCSWTWPRGSAPDRSTSSS